MSKKLILSTLLKRGNTIGYLRSNDFFIDTGKQWSDIRIDTRKPRTKNQRKRRKLARQSPHSKYAR